MSERSADLVRLVQERYERAARKQREIIDEMEIARLMFRGDQWLTPIRHKWLPAPEPKWRVRLVINKLPVLVELSIATFTRFKPVITARPATDEREDIASAKISEKLLQHYWDFMEMDLFLIDALTWSLVCGNVFIRPRWDPSLGGYIPINEEKNEFTTEGDLTADVIDPFSMTIDPGAKSFYKSKWFIVTEMMSVEDVDLRFNKRVEPSTAMEESLHIPMLIEDAMDVDNREYVAVHQMYEKPTKEYEMGRMLYVAGQEILGEPESLPNGEARVIEIPCIRLPGEAWPTSLVTQVMSLQMELNRGRSQLVENRNLCGRPQVMAAEGSMDIDMMTAEPGVINWYNPIASHGRAPEYMTPPTVPGWVLRELDQTNQDMMDLSSRHEASQGMQGGGVTSGKQAAIYRSADDSRLAPRIRSFESALQKFGKYCLSEFVENAGTHERIIRLVGRTRMHEVLKFQGNRVTDKCNVKFDISSKIPWARESQRQQLIYLNAIGKITDEELKEQLEIPENHSTWEFQQDHRLNARTENEFLKETYFPPMPTDNDQIHIEEHMREINLPENRVAQIAELIQQEQAKANMEAMGTPPEKHEKFPASCRNVLRHLEEHRKRIKPPAPPPPAAKINLNPGQLLDNPLVQMNPKIAQQLIQQIMKLTQNAASSPGKGPPPSGTRAPINEPPGITTPPGSSSDIQGTGSSASIGIG